MKAVVLELRDRRASVLDERGTVRLVPDRGYEVGQEIQLTGSFAAFPIVRAAAGILLCAALGSAVWNFPAYAVPVEAGIAISYTVNCFERVIRVEGGPELDEETVLALRREVRGRPLAEAVDRAETMLGERQQDCTESSGAAPAEAFSGEKASDDPAPEESVPEETASEEPAVSAPEDREEPAWAAEDPEKEGVAASVEPDLSAEESLPAGDNAGEPDMPETSGDWGPGGASGE